MSTGIKCCKDCVAPKRYPGCHSKCPEYIQEKEDYEKYKQIIAEQRRTWNELYEQRSKGIQKAIRKRR